MRRERMPQRVGRDGLGDSRLVDVFAQDLPGAHSRERLAAGIEEQHTLPFALLQLGTQLAQVDCRRADRATTDWNEPLLGSLAEDAHEMILEHPVADIERDPLGHAQAGTVSELQHRPVPKRQRLVERRSREKLLYLVDAEDVR